MDLITLTVLQKILLLTSILFVLDMTDNFNFIKHVIKSYNKTFLK